MVGQWKLESSVMRIGVTTRIGRDRIHRSDQAFSTTCVELPMKLPVNTRSSFLRITIHCPMIQSTPLPLISELVDSSNTEEPRCRV